MDCTNFKEIDSQILVENVSFLDNCFNNSFTIHNSLISVKDYIADTHSTGDKGLKKISKRVPLSRNSLHNSLNLSLTTQEVVSEKKEELKNIRDLRKWGLPQEIVNKYKLRGITEMFQWQVSCLSKAEVLLDYRNLVYSAPTSAGKTLVAEILAIKTILERQKKVLIILPFVSIVREKMRYLQDILSSSGIRVEGFMGSQTPPGGLQAVHVAICTIEKANSLVNRLLDEGNISELGAVVVDELHLLGDSNRGYILELLLTKIKYISLKTNNVKIQIIGMSATLPNLEVLASWLDADLFVTDFRPIPLEEYCLVGNKFYDKHGQYLRSLNKDISTERDNEGVIGICLETIKGGCSILIFCMTKNRCENLAQGIASTFFKLGCTENEMGKVLRDQLKSENIIEVLEQLKNCPVGLDGILKNIVSFGVAYHHAGLTLDERDIIEGAFKSGAIRVLVATSTLSSGVNLPARKVIIRTPVFQKQPINILTYKQMIGRAGRMGKDVKGESVLICTEAEKKLGLELMAGILEPVRSCIESEDRYMRAVLEIIASQEACSKAELDLYSKCTLLFNQEENSHSQILLLENTLDHLKNYELIRVQNVDDEEQYVATSLGKACLSSSMAPNDGLSLFCELQKARQCMVLENDLHLIYLVTPYSVSSQWNDIDWLHLLTLWESLTRAMKKVGELVGIQESFIVQRLRGSNKMKVSQNKLNIHKRFYTALALQDLVNEVPLSEVAKKFQCARGFLQGLQQAAATFAGMVTAFCRQLGWKNMELIISQFQDRLHFGIHSELIELMKLSSLNGIRARALFDGGLETISDVASADVNIIENILLKAVPFQSEKEREVDDEDDIRKRNKIKNIWITGNCGMTANEAAKNLIYEARKFLQLEIGVTEIKWKELKVAKASDDVLDVNSNAKQEVHEKHSYYNEQLFAEHALTNKLEQKSLITTEEVNSLKIDNNISKLEKNVLVRSNLINSQNQSKIDDEISQNEDKNYNEIKVKTKESPLINNIAMFINDNPSISNKNDIVWESLNFTTALDNISKVRVSDRINSPEISFGENQNNISLDVDDGTSLDKATVRDLSLFSSDENDSIVFDETLPIDLLPNTMDCNREQLLYSRDVSIHNVTIDAQSILNAFTSSLAVNEDDEDIKLVYEEDKKEDKPSVLNTSQDIEIINSQKVIRALNTNYKSPLKRQRGKKNSSFQPLSKKIKVNSKLHFLATLKSKQSKYSNIEIQGKLIHCYVLREKDLIQCSESIQSNEEASIYFDMKKYCDIDLCAAPIKIGNMVTELKKIDSVEIMLLKAWCVWSVAEKQQRHLLQQYQDINDVVRVETHVSRILADCESNGLLVDRQLASQLLIDVRNSQEILQKKAYKLCGYHFNFNSPKDVAKVLGMYKGRKVSTKKSVLTAHNSPMASIVIYWRKLNAILTKTLYPLTERASVYNTDNRINPSYTMQTCTGRITMREPNLQNVPRTFSVPVKYLTLTSENDLCADTIEFNCRDAFKAAPGCVFVSADYCQLEMRILTHYSGDPVLTDIMRSDVDVFKAIAASWSCVSEEEVDDDLRQKAKQLCYGILYGMGNRTLSQHLDVTEAEAAVFMDSFYKTYPAVKVFTHSIVDTCRRQGYVETLRKRRRYLPDINSTLAFKRCAAERQAVNTTIQGSAADIAKAAMCAVDDATRIERFKPRLVLQMHDELIYEVDESYCREFAKVLKRLMEETVRLDVPLPVKVKSGPSWGCLNEIAVV